MVVDGADYPLSLQSSPRRQLSRYLRTTLLRRNCWGFLAIRCVKIVALLLSSRQRRTFHSQWNTATADICRFSTVMPFWTGPVIWMTLLRLPDTNSYAAMRPSYINVRLRWWQSLPLAASVLHMTLSCFHKLLHLVAYSTVSFQYFDSCPFTFILNCQSPYYFIIPAASNENR